MRVTQRDLQQILNMQPVEISSVVRFLVRLGLAIEAAKVDTERGWKAKTYLLSDAIAEKLK